MKNKPLAGLRFPAMLKKKGPIVVQQLLPIRVLRAIGLFLSLLWLTSCSTLSTNDKKDRADTPERTNEPDVLFRVEPTVTQPDVIALEQLLPALQVQGSAAPERFDVIANNTPARVFFNSLVDGTAYNVIVHPEVSGHISLTLRNVTLAETLSAVQDLYGLDVVRSQYGIQVLPRRQQTKLYPINYLNVTRTGRSGMSVSSGQISSNRSSTSEGGINSTQTNNQVVNASQVETESGSHFWHNLRVTLELMVRNDPTAQIVVDAQAGIVIVHALSHVQQDVQRYLEKAELIVQRQVIIEAKILEVTLNAGFQTGVNWSGFHGVQNIGGSRYNVNSELTSQPVTNPDFIEGIFSLGLTGANFQGMIELLQTQGDVSVLSSPRIATMNNQKAVIKVGSDEYFVTDISNSTTTSTTGVSQTPDIELTPFFSGVALDVTPQIADNGEIILHVHPTITEVVERTKLIELNQDTFKLPLAFSSVRETDSIIRAQSGQIVVIGGLMQSKKINTVAKIPLLGDIPFLGILFRQQREQTLQSELVILLQPQVVGNALSDDELQRLNDRYSPIFTPIMPGR